MSDSFENFLAQAKSGRMPVLELVRAADQLKGKAPAQNIAALYQTWIDHHTNDGLMYALRFKKHWNLMRISRPFIFIWAGFMSGWGRLIFP